MRVQYCCSTLVPELCSGSNIGYSVFCTRYTLTNDKKDGHHNLLLTIGTYEGKGATGVHGNHINKKSIKVVVSMSMLSVFANLRDVLFTKHDYATIGIRWTTERINQLPALTP